MHCQACDCLLTDFEATRRSATTGEFLDLCNTCYSSIEDEVPAIERDDLRTVDSIEDDNYED